jgi:hypothetical protein
MDDFSFPRYPMRDEEKTREQLLRELQEARLRIAELEDMEIRRFAALDLIQNSRNNLGSLGSWSLDLQTDRLHIEQQYGTPSPLCGSGPKCSSHIHADDLKKLKEFLHNVETDGLRDFTHRLVTPDGDIRTLAVSALLWQSPGEEAELSGAYQDGTPVQELMQNLDIPVDIRRAFALGCETSAPQL